MPMKIIADENIPYLEQFFTSYGEITTVPGRKINAAIVENADVLLVRSITQVNETLLKNSKVSFVGSATIGMDHIDTQYLRDRGIEFHNAPGCNADSVVQYVLAALLHLDKFYHFDLASKTVGIIGCGNIGSRLQRSLVALGVQYKTYDPFLDEVVSGPQVSFEEVMGCDAVTLHVPITTMGAFPTKHMINEPVLRRMKPDTVLINSSRGAVIDNQALLKSLQEAPRIVVLDVWENEPDIEWGLLDYLAIATPHIAGYSAEGKAKGTQMLYQALANWGKKPASLTLTQFMPVAPVHKIQLSEELTGPIPALHKLIKCCYSIEDDDKRLRLASKQSDRNQRFDLLRKNYGGRREFSSLTLNVQTPATREAAELSIKLQTLGFEISKVDDANQINEGAT
ncbi:MAG: 4-phosphoerythronate dehydrogenase [Pseudomonadales bacterium]|nr:4-phosphoerythronate dehydrogenase [Pseudomonadales bacterium]